MVSIFYKNLYQGLYLGIVVQKKLYAKFQSFAIFSELKTIQIKVAFWTITMYVFVKFELIPSSGSNVDSQQGYG